MLPKLPGLENIKNLGVGLAKGVGTLATAPGYLADLITKNRGFEIKNADEIKQKSAQWEEMTKPIGKLQEIAHGIGSLNPGTELLSPQLQKLGMPSKVAFSIGLGIDILTPGPGEVGKAKTVSKISTKIESKLEPLAQEARKMRIMPIDQAIKKFDVTGSVTIAERPGARLVMKDEGTFVKVGMDFGAGKLVDTELAKTLPEKNFATKEEAFDFIKSLTTKPKITTGLESLAVEARKYKTAEEFVKAQTNVFHGTEVKFSPESIKPTKGTQGTGIYLTLDKNVATKYARGGEVIGYAGQDLKLADTSKFTKEQSAQFSDAYEKAVKQLGEHSDEATNQAYKSMGFDGKKITGDEIMLFDNAKLKTKSQLTDIYNQAVSKVSEKALPKTEELAKAKSIAKTLPPLPQLESGKIPQVSKALPPSIPPGAGDVNKLFDDSVAKLTEVLKRAEPIRGEITQLQSEARSLKVGEAAKAQEAIGGERGYYTALSKLKGKLVPEDKIVFQSIRRELGDVDVENIFKKIQSQPDFTFFDKLDSQTAFTKLLKGEIPTEGEIQLLRRVFPKATIDALLEKRPLMQKITDAGYQIINLPRTIMSGLGDFSASFRQGVFFAAGRPQRFFNAFFNQFKYFVSEKSFNGLMQEIKSRPNYGLMRDYKLALTDLDTITSREEKIMANWGEKIPIIGRAIRATGRAYTGFLNKLRADVFDDLVKKGTTAGRNINEYGPSLARYINSATGRGSLGMFERSAKLLNGFFFSPRLMASRINLMNPVYYARLDPFVRKEAVKDLFAFVSTGLTILGLAKLYGPEVTVGWDWRSSDFGKMRIGNTRIDIWGGFQQYARMLGQLWTGEYVSSTTGKVTTLGEGYKPLTGFDILLRQLETKEAPVASLITTLLRGQDFAGKKVNVPTEVAKRFIPMFLGDVYDLSKTDPDLVPLSLLSVFGVGIQSYKPTLKPGGALFKGGLPSGGLPGQSRLPSLPGL